MNNNVKTIVEYLQKAELLENGFGKIVSASLKLTDDEADKTIGSSDADNVFLARKKSDIRSCRKSFGKIGKNCEFASRTACMTVKTLILSAEKTGLLANIKIDIDAGKSVSFLTEKYGTKQKKEIKSVTESAFDSIESAILLAVNGNFLALLVEKFTARVEEEKNKISESEQKEEKKENVA